MRQVGARNYQFDIDTGIATFLPQVGGPLDLTAVEAAVTEAGFGLLWLDLELLGELSRTQDGDGSAQPALTVGTTGQRFLLYPGESDEEREGYARLTQWLDQPEQAVTVRGRAHAHRTALPALTVREFAVH